MCTRSEVAGLHAIITELRSEVAGLHAIITELRATTTGNRRTCGARPCVSPAAEPASEPPEPTTLQAVAAADACAFLSSKASVAISMSQ